MPALAAALFIMLTFSFAPTSTTVYLPIAPGSDYLKGVEADRNRPQLHADELADLGLDVVRYHWGVPGGKGLWWHWENDHAATVAQIHADKAVLDANGIAMNMVIIGNHAGTCSRVPGSEFGIAADFMAEVAAEFQPDFIEIWNEPDLTGGGASFYGCWGTGKTNGFINYVQAMTPAILESSPDTLIGSSFALQNAAAYDMLHDAAPYLDFLGVHYYQVWVNGTVTDPWPLDIDGIGIVKPIYFTETNLLNDGDCTDPDYLQAQADFVDSTFGLPVHGVTVYALVPHNAAWRCAALLDANKDPLPAYDALKEQ